MIRRLALLPFLAVLAVLALLPLGGAARAQGTTREKIDSAKTLYQNFDVEQARLLLQPIISPGYLQPVTPAERVEAYKYLGASYALVDKRDSAVTYFVAALDFDAFTDLDPQIFSATELSAFAEAKQRIFKAGIRPAVSQVVNPRVDSTAYTFRVVTTHSGDLKVELLNQDSTVREVLYQGRSAGERPITWRGVLTTTGQVAPPGTYMVRAIATDPAVPNAADVRDLQFIRIEHHTEALEDTLPPFSATDTLPTQFAARAPWLDLTKGVFVGALAGLALPRAASLDDNVKSWQLHAIAAGAVVITSGSISFLYRRQNRNIAENLEETTRRKDKRAAFNKGVSDRNQLRLDRRLLIITPASGFR